MRPCNATDGPPKSVPPGPCTAATDDHPGPSMAPETVPLGPSMAPQVVPLAITGPPTRSTFYTYFYTPKPLYDIMFHILSEDSWKTYEGLDIDVLQKEGFKLTNNKNHKGIAKEVCEFSLVMSSCLRECSLTTKFTNLP